MAIGGWQGRVKRAGQSRSGAIGPARLLGRMAGVLAAHTPEQIRRGEEDDLLR